jgi:hypothetical protein
LSRKSFAFSFHIPEQEDAPERATREQHVPESYGNAPRNSAANPINTHERGHVRGLQEPVVNV